MTNARPSGRVYLLSTQNTLAESLRSVLESHGIEIVVFVDLSALMQAAAEEAPEVIIFDLILIPAGESLKTLCEKVADITHRRSSLIGLAADQERGGEMIERRLAARRAGLVSYIAAPVSVRHLARRILALCGFLEFSRYHILLAAEDPGLGRRLAPLLASVGMKTLVVGDPMKLLARMQAFKPNLLLMEMNFSQMSGVELAAIIRDDEQFHRLPILFLTDESDPIRQLWALRAGGDGFIPRSAGREVLIAAIEQQLRLSRWLQDRLTLSNRRESARGFLPQTVFMSYLQCLLHIWRPGSEKQGLLLLDLDAGQRLLQRLGHGGVERLLRELEQSLGRHLTVNEAATRLDDFRYAILARRDGHEKLQALADQLHDQVHALALQEPTHPLTLSIGVASFDPLPADLQSLLSRAECAVQSASQAGGDRVHVWSPVTTESATVMTESVVKRLVKTALAQDGLCLLFQPILPLDSHTKGFYEAQIRLRTLGGDELSPADFLAVAARAELMQGIDRWVLQRTWQTMAKQAAHGLPARLLVHQNITTLMASDWFGWLRQQQKQPAPIQVQSQTVLEFQLTEIRRRHHEAATLFRHLAEHGIDVCVANVTGSEDEAHLLARLGVHLAKLTIAMGRTTDQAYLVKSIHTLRLQGVDVIVPGIDSPDDLRRVWMCRPDFIQGHYLQLPSPDLNFDFQTLVQ